MRWLLSIESDTDEPERLEQTTHRLLEELRAVGAVRVDPMRSTAPTSAKSGGGMELGQLVLSGVFSAASATTFARIMVAHFDRAKARRFHLERDGQTTEFEGLSEKDQHMLVQAIADTLRNEDDNGSTNATGER